MPKREKWICSKCKTPNLLPSGAYRSLTCIGCDTTHAMVNIEGERKIFPYYLQEKPQPKKKRKPTDSLTFDPSD